MAPARPNPNLLRRSARERTSVTPHTVATPGSDGGGLMKHHTEVDDVYPVGETRTLARGARTRNGDDSAEPPNRFVLHLSSIDESSEHEVH